MKNLETFRNGVRVVPSCGNIFMDLGFDEPEANIMFTRTNLMIDIRLFIEGKGWTQAEAAKHLGITQPRVSKLMKRKYADFSIDMLLLLAGRLGLHHELKLAA